MASAQNLLGHLFLEFSLVACRLFSLTLRCALLEATFRNLFSLFLVGSKNNVSALFWLRFRMVWALYFFLFWALYFFLFSGFQKRRFGFAMARAQNLLGFCFFACASQNTFFLSLAWWLAGFFFVFSRFQKQRFGSFLAAVSHGLGTLSFFSIKFQKRRFGIFPAAVSQWLVRVARALFLCFFFVFCCF